MLDLTLFFLLTKANFNYNYFSKVFFLKPLKSETRPYQYSMTVLAFKKGKKFFYPKGSLDSRDYTLTFLPPLFFCAQHKEKSVDFFATLLPSFPRKTKVEQERERIFFLFANLCPALFCPGSFPPPTTVVPTTVSISFPPPTLLPRKENSAKN